MLYRSPFVWYSLGFSNGSVRNKPSQIVIRILGRANISHKHVNINPHNTQDHNILPQMNRHTNTASNVGPYFRLKKPISISMRRSPTFCLGDGDQQLATGVCRSVIDNDTERNYAMTYKPRKRLIATINDLTKVITIPELPTCFKLRALEVCKGEKSLL